MSHVPVDNITLLFTAVSSSFQLKFMFQNRISGWVSPSITLTRNYVRLRVPAPHFTLRSRITECTHLHMIKYFSNKQFSTTSKLLLRKCNSEFRFCDLYTKIQEVLVRTNGLLSLIRHGPQKKQQKTTRLAIFYCCVYIRCRGNVFLRAVP
jgi:hypothetical protein